MIWRKLNPTDLSFLRLIKITKKIFDCRFDNDIIVYYIWFRNKKIGYVELIEGSNTIEDIKIDEKYRRKGLATYLYDHIEKDLKIKLRPNSIQLSDGEAFWKARRKNPTNYELLKEIEIQKLKITKNNYSNWGDPGQILYRILDKNHKMLGQARYDPKRTVVDDIAIYEMKRQGLATYLYDYIESDQKIILRPSETLLEDGQAFWKARLNK